MEIEGGGYSLNGDGVVFTVDSVEDVDISGNSTIRLPTDADQTLKNHENGHDALSQNEYDKNAKRKVEAAMAGFKGMKFTGKGATPQDRLADANAQATKERDRRLEAAKKAIEQQIGTLNEKYDKLTKHGASPDVDTEKGKKQALAERDKAPKAGTDPCPVNPKLPNGGIKNSPKLSLNPDSQSLNFGGNTLLDTASDPSDPILGRGSVQIQPLILIGTQPNGTTLFSDGRFQIVDTVTNELFLDAFLFELAYMPSNVPGFAGMLHGYLDVPPDFAGGVQNSIGSNLLSGLQQSRDAGEMTMFWFYVDQPLVGSDASSTITGKLQIGTAICPEPGPIAFAILAASSVLGLIARKRKA